MSTMLEYKCPACGGAIRFDSKLQKMKCPYCETEFEMETLRTLDRELRQESPDNINWKVTGRQWPENEAEGMVVYVCKSCGGEIIGDENMAATSCPFCDNPVVMMQQFTGQLRPDYVIPFKLDKKAAVGGLNKHLQKKRLLPKIFKDKNHIEEIRGIYVPHWLFHAEAKARIRYKGAKVKTWTSGDYRYTKTDIYAILREGSLAFERIPVDGSTKMPDDLMESIEPYDFQGAVDFQTAYLAGYLADKYDVPAEESIGRANVRVKESVVQAFRATVKNFVQVTPEQSSIQIENGLVQYALFPVWILNTIWNGRKYVFAMNGQTGKFVGDLPVDRGACWKWFGMLTAIFAVASYVLARLVL